MRARGETENDSLTPTRREFLITSAAAAAALPFARAFGMDFDPNSPFQHGIASGDPFARSVLLWTRITPATPRKRVKVAWLIAKDPGLKRVVDGGLAFTFPERDLTVKVVARGLEPGTTYYYQFFALGHASRVGRTRTLPVGDVERLRMAVVCCSNLPFGFFNAYGLVAQRDDLDVVLHLGDYIYEYRNGEYGDGSTLDPPRIPQPDKEIITLEDYRIRHAQYKLDPFLQEAHRQHPFIVVWDDHEFANDAFQDGAENHNPEQGGGPWLARKRAAQQAFFEWLPIRTPNEFVDRAGDEDGGDEHGEGFATLGDSRIFRRFRYGNLMDLMMLDSRIIERDEQAMGPLDPSIEDPRRQLLGTAQEDFLFRTLRESHARGTTWRVLGQQVMIGQLVAPEGEPIFLDIDQRPLLTLNPDQWDGYSAARNRLYDVIEGEGINNVVVLTGDIHSSWAHELSRNPYDPAVYDPNDPNRVALGVEFVATAVTSPAIPDKQRANVAEVAIRRTQPHNKFVDLFSRGYIVLDVDTNRTQSEWFFVDTIEEPRLSENFAAGRKTETGTNLLQTALRPSSPKPNPPAPAP